MVFKTQLWIDIIKINSEAKQDGEEHSAPLIAFVYKMIVEGILQMTPNQISFYCHSVRMFY